MIFKSFSGCFNIFSFFKRTVKRRLCFILLQLHIGNGQHKQSVICFFSAVTKSGSKLWNWPLKTGSIVKPPTCFGEKEDGVSGKRTLPGESLMCGTNP